jgi:hypothetical protein
MGVAEEAGTVRAIRRWRTVSEKRRIAELTLEPGASVALVARARGVTVEIGAKEQSTPGGAIHIEFPGKANDQRGERS